MKKNNFYGMMPILPTAISPDGKIDEKSMRRLVQYCIKFNAAAIGHFGFASEFHKISDTDRRVLTEIIVDETAGSVPVFIGINSQGFNISLRYAEEAEKLGAELVGIEGKPKIVSEKKESNLLFKLLENKVLSYLPKQLHIIPGLQYLWQY